MPSSSPVLTYAAVVALSFCIGYYAGSGTRLPIRGTLPRDETEDQVDYDLGVIKAHPLEVCKLVLVVRSDLGMSAGKIAAQCSHATLACYKALSWANPSLLRHWEMTGQTKIAVRCKNEEEMLLLEAQAQSLSLCAQTIQDAGKTQIAAGSRTVLGIGPGPVHLVDRVTRHLKLL